MEDDTQSSAKKPKDPTSVLKMELGDVLGRYDRPPPFDKAKPLAPFGSEPAWVPSIWRKRENSKGFDLVPPTSAWKALDRALVLVQNRMREAGNKALIAGWLNFHLPRPPRPGTAPAGDGDDPMVVTPLGFPGFQLHMGTVLYREVSKHAVGGDPKQGEEVPYIGSDVIGATARRLEQLCARLWKPKVPKLPALDERWPVFFRPKGWRLLPDNTIAFNFDGTWWHVSLRTPRPKKGKAKGAARKAIYVNSTLQRLQAGEPERGVSAAVARVSDTKWIPSTLALIRNEKRWTAILSYRYPARPVYPVQNAMVVHCGLRFFATYQDVENLLQGRGAERVTGGGLLARRYQFRQQRQRLMRAARKFAKPGRGHAYQARAFATKATERAYTDDWLRRRARRIASVAKERKAVIFVGELSNVRDRTENSDLPKGVKTAVHQAPWYRFRLFLQEAASKVGVPCETYKQYSHTVRCPNPSCGVHSRAAVKYHTWSRVCIACGHTRNLDDVAVANAIWDLAHAGRITLPNRQNYTDFFKKIDEYAAQQEAERRANRERAHFTGVGDAPFGKTPRGRKSAAPGASSSKRGRRAKPEKRPN